MTVIRTRASIALATFASMLPLRAHCACQLEMAELPVKMVGSRAVATVRINGSPVPLTVDSGAFFSILTEAAATQLGLKLRNVRGVRVEGITGPVDARVTTVDKLQLLKGEIPRVEFIVGGNEPGAGTMGLLGRNILAYTDTEYDLANGVVRLSFPNADCAKANLAYWAGSSHVSEIDLEPDYQGRRGIPELRSRVKLNGKELVAMFDTGATTIVTAQAARRAGISDAQLTPSHTIYGAGRGSARSWTAPFAQFQIGDETIAHNRLPVGDFTLDNADLLIGVDFFLSHRIYVSKQRDKMFVTYNGGTVFALNRSGSADRAAPPGEAAASSAQAASADELARRGGASASRGEYRRALADVNAAISLDPTSAAHFAQRGVIHEALERPSEATADFDKALELDPAQTDARLRRAELRLRSADRDGARSDLGALDDALAPQAQMRLEMARLYAELGEFARSLAQLNHWLVAHPDEAWRHVGLDARCRARVMLGIELDKALDDCNAAIAADGKNADYLDSRGWVHLRAGRDERALVDFDRSIALRPGRAWPLYGRGLIKLRLGDAVQGEADLAAARQAQPDIDARVARANLAAEPLAKR